MTAVLDEAGVKHVVSDGIENLSRDRQYALCDIMVIAATPRGSTFTHPARNWDFSDVDEDAIPNCIACVAAVREAIEDP
jgi:hypothetical protein